MASRIALEAQIDIVCFDVQMNISAIDFHRIGKETKFARPNTLFDRPARLEFRQLVTRIDAGILHRSSDTQWGQHPRY